MLNKIWVTIKFWYYYLLIYRRFSGYKPQPVTFQSFKKWLSQFDYKDQRIVFNLLYNIKYLSEKDTESILVKLNESLIDMLETKGVTYKNIIYVQLHDPGSSSPVMLNILRDRARIERKGCHFIDSKNTRDFSELTSKLETGAIIYVDDFSASGDQFVGVRNFLAEYIVGNFSEFFLLPAICEEANYQLGKTGVEAISRIVHSKADRPLHPHSSLLNKATKKRLIEICRKIDPKGALGYRGLATMIVFYRNSPNTVPVLLRGCVRQDKWVGILPRTTDLS
jgi:hypothetical protein